MKIKEIFLSTKNKNKIIEIKKFLLPYKINIKTPYDFPLYKDTIEDGLTLKENSLKKAIEGFKFSGLPTLADDTGLEVDYLNKEPGVYSARWAGENCSYKDNNDKLLEKLKNIDFKNRKANFICILTFVIKESETYFFEGKLEGYINQFPIGERGFGYDPLFYVEEEKKTFAQLDLDKKNKISHRAKALEKFKIFLDDLNK